RRMITPAVANLARSRLRNAGGKVSLRVVRRIRSLSCGSAGTPASPMDLSLIGGFFLRLALAGTLTVPNPRIEPRIDQIHQEVDQDIGHGENRDGCDDQRKIL